MFLFSFSKNFPPSVFSSPTLDNDNDLFIEEKRQEREVFNLFLSASAPVGQIFLHETFLEKIADDFKFLQDFCKLSRFVGLLAFPPLIP